MLRFTADTQLVLLFPPCKVQTGQTGHWELPLPEGEQQAARMFPILLDRERDLSGLISDTVLTGSGAQWPSQLHSDMG